jgi:hypothetical protein
VRQTSDGGGGAGARLHFRRPESLAIIQVQAEGADDADDGGASVRLRFRRPDPTHWQRSSATAQVPTKWVGDGGGGGGARPDSWRAGQ